MEARIAVILEQCAEDGFERLRVLAWCVAHLDFADA